MAIEAETHAQGLGLTNLIHLVDPSVTFHTTDAAGDMDGMVEINVIRGDVNLHPGNGGVIGGAFANDGQARIVFQDLIVAVHAGGSRGNIGHPGFIHVAVAVTTVDAQLSGMDLVRKRHRLNRLVTDAVIFRRDIDRHACGHGSPHQRGTNAQRQR